jgi:hypothetical protein
MKRFIVLLLICAFGCGIAEMRASLKYPKLPPDIESASANQRLEVYHQFEPTEATLIVPEDQAGKPAIQKITLADGTEIYELSQLTGLVLPNSYTEQQIQKSLLLRKRGLKYLLGFPAGLVLSAPFLLAGGVTNSDVLLGIGVGSIAAGFLAPFVSLVPLSRSNKARTQAFLTYDQALMDRLKLCKIGDVTTAECGATP